MLMFIFGAGASFDSDPERTDPRNRIQSYDFRPPLAAGLFSPDNDLGKKIIAEHPRAASLLMRLRQATRRDEDVEEVLERIALGSDAYPATETQLLAFRAYLASLMDEVPAKWHKECQGLTNYIPALEQADRWNTVLHSDSREPIACVTFNYDTLLEQAVASVFGHPLDHIDRYTSHPGIHVYKPHGSVTWRQAARWDHPANNWVGGIGGLGKAVDEAATLRWSDEFRCQSNDQYQDQDDATRVWLPALSIPVRRKATFTLPKAHEVALLSDLRKVTTVIAVGWRAREQHFLRVLQDYLGSDLVRLVAVAENDENAKATVDSLWETGRFDRYAISGVGFSGFTATPTEQYRPLPNSDDHTRLTLDHVLTAGTGSSSGLWITREPSTTGIPDLDEDALSPHPSYGDL